MASWEYDAEHGRPLAVAALSAYCHRTFPTIRIHIMDACPVGFLDIHPPTPPLFDESYICPECGDTWNDAEDAERCCHVNEDCPSGCTDDHDAPTFAHGGGWACPATGEQWYWEGSEDSGAWETLPWWCSPAYIDPIRVWTSDPSEYEYGTCENCDQWVHYDDGATDEDGEGFYCESCRPVPNGGTTTYAHCCTCGLEVADNAVLMVDPISEYLYCADHAPVGTMAA